MRTTEEMSKEDVQKVEIQARWRLRETVERKKEKMKEKVCIEVGKVKTQAEINL